MTQSPSSAPAPPIDLSDFRTRAFQIAREREAAGKARLEHALKEADADHDYALQKALRYTELRAAGKGQDESQILSEGDTVVAEHKRRRARENGLKKAAEYRVEECERNAATLRQEAAMSEGL